jgi:uncharacterized protein (TIGR00730 family)
MPKKVRGKTLRSAKYEAKEYLKSKKFIGMEAISSYRLAFLDHDFLLREDLRPVRLQLELLKPELIQKENDILATIVIFGSARIHEATVMHREIERLEEIFRLEPRNKHLERKLQGAQSLLKKSKFYDEARKLAQLFSKTVIDDEDIKLVITTGGGPGIMEAANRGAHDVEAKSVGFGIVLPSEETPNKYVTPELLFQFHYFAIRKMHFLMRARALIAFPGGFGTLDELFEALTLMQQHKITHIPLVLIGREYWDKVINFEAMVDEGVIHPEDLQLFHYAETAQEAYDFVMSYYEEKAAD